MEGEDLTDRIIIVTGANTGIGKETVRYISHFLKFPNFNKISISNMQFQEIGEKNVFCKYLKPMQQLLWLAEV